MTTKIIYTVVFAATFLLVTLAVIMLNDQYVNMFAFDFSPVPEIKNIVSNSPAQGNTSDLKKYIAQIKDELLDSMKTIGGKSRVDTVFTEKIKKDPTLVDSIKNIKNKMVTIEKELLAKNTEIQNLKSLKKANQDSAYVKWKKDMIKIYESMDSKAAAKIIQNMEANLAKDILFSMKKKKAAEIIMKLNPETASRLTRME